MQALNPIIKLTAYSHCTHSFDFYLKVLLSSEDLKMMMDEVTMQYNTSSDSDNGPATVNLRTFLLIMEYSPW
jgi:hypothetical protein